MRPSPRRQVRHRSAALGSLLALVVAGSSAGLAVPVPASAAEAAVDRVAGGDRYQTAALLSAASYAPGVGVVHLSDGATFPDALAAGAAAAAGRGPVLLTTSSGLPPATADELFRLRPLRVVVTGGTAAVSDRVLAEVRALTGAAVTRVGGTDRYDTAARLSSVTFAPGVPTVWVATGTTAPDALSASAAAGAAGGPVLLTRPDGLPGAVEAELRRLAPRRIVVAGGGSAVPEAIRLRLTMLAPAVTRVAGPDRYATSAAISGYGFPAPTAARVVLASGEQFPDALVAAPVAARTPGPVLLVRPGCIPEDAAHELDSLAPATVTLLGGIAALGPELDLLTPCPPLIADGVLADGVSLTSLRSRNGPAGPLAIRVVTVDLSRPSTLDTVLAGDGLPGLETTTSMGKRREAVVAVNGDFFLADGRPVHVFAEDGELATSASDRGRGFAVTTDEKRSYIGYLDLRTAVTGPDEERLSVDRVNNGPATAGQRALHTDVGGDLEVPPVQRCTARFRSAGPPALTSAGRVEQPLVTSGPACADPAPPGDGEAVLTAAPFEPLPSWPAGSAARWDWYLEGWPGVLDVMGGNPSLVIQAALVEAELEGEGSFFQRNPRTAVGFTADGKALIVVVDGRQAGFSVGMTLRELAELMRSLGAVEALNLDGGGSTIMTVNGVAVSRPSAGTERPVANAVLVLPGADPGEVDGVPALSQRSSATAQSVPQAPPVTVPAAQVWPEVAADPGSAGGMLGLTD